ncbi:hypothetical protein ACFPU0_11715 [Pseudomonas sp. GCM10022186]|uniref:hypothetical protein n=1 Tax=Pseudomonas sp. GCM10022186 TaxID=3252650 RepID=UPI00360CECE0
MNTSLRLLLEDFLGLMREEGELDAFLPLLMSGMGHEVVYRAQKGPRQYGVDISSVGPDSDGETKLFLWLVKCGDIGRTEWNSGPQAIRQSIEDVEDVYLRSHVAPEFQQLKKKLLVVTNGDFKASLNETIAGYLESWCARNGTEAEQVNGSTLAFWTEQFLLNEYILPADSRTLLRRMLANVVSPDLCASVGRVLIDQLVSSATAPAKTKGAKAKKLLTNLRGIRTALSVLQIWAQGEKNLLAPYRLAEYAVLAVWAGLHDEMLAGNAAIAKEFAQLLAQLSNVADAYHERLEPYYVVQDAFANALPDSLLVSKAVFDELGRLGLQGCLCSLQVEQTEETLMIAQCYARRIESLLQTHSCSALPAYDHHSANIHMALLLLATTNRIDEARQWVRRLCQRLSYATNLRRFMPMSAPFEEAILIRQGEEEMADEFCSTSTLIPILLTWTASLGMQDSYSFLRDHVVPSAKGTTPNFWNADKGYDSIVSDPGMLHAHGAGEAIGDIPEVPEEFLRAMSEGLSEIEPIESSAWYQLDAHFIPMLAGIHWQSQLPRQFLVRQAARALVRSNPPESADT